MILNVANYIDKNILCEAYIHVHLPSDITAERLEEIKNHLTQFAVLRGKFFVYPEVEVSVEFREGSLKSYITIAGVIYAAVCGYGSFRSGVDYLYTDIKRLGDSLVNESLFMTKSKYDKIVQTEARTGVIGSLKNLVDDMNSFEDSIGQVSVEETTRRLKQIKTDADTLLANVRSERDVENIQDELAEFSEHLPQRCPHPHDRRPDDVAIISYSDVFLEFRKTYGKKKKIRPDSDPLKRKFDL
jgi:hypothetical protein